MDKPEHSPSPSGEGLGWGTAPAAHQLSKYAREMRNAPTEPEKYLWMALRNSQLEGFKFRRQSVIGHRIVDFLCPSKGLIVEVDGDTHDINTDARLDEELLKQGFTTLRFTNREVCDNMDGVLIVILDKLRALPDRWPHPNPVWGQSCPPDRTKRPQTPEGEGL